jgi:hypothetical protein
MVDGGSSAQPSNTKAVSKMLNCPDLASQVPGNVIAGRNDPASDNRPLQAVGEGATATTPLVFVLLSNKGTGDQKRSRKTETSQDRT